MAANTRRDLEKLCDVLRVPPESWHWVIRRAQGRPDAEDVIRLYAERILRDQADQ